MATAKKKVLAFTVLANIVHDGIQRVKDDVIEFEDHIEHSDTIKTLLARGVIKPIDNDEETVVPEAGAPDPAMAPAAIKENDSGSNKVDVVNE